MNRFLNFLSLLDREGRLSITNVAMYVVLAKLVFAPGDSLTEIGMLLVTFANYAHKRFTSSDKEVSSTQGADQSEARFQQLEEFQKKTQDKLGAIQLGLSMKR